MCCGPWGRKESDTTERLNSNSRSGPLSSQMQMAEHCRAHSPCWEPGPSREDALTCPPVPAKDCGPTDNPSWSSSCLRELLTQRKGGIREYRLSSEEIKILEKKFHPPPPRCNTEGDATPMGDAKAGQWGAGWCVGADTCALQRQLL